MAGASQGEVFLSNTATQMLEDRDLADTLFVVQGQNFYGIRSVFGAASPVFKKMLFGSMMESQLQTEEKTEDSDDIDGALSEEDSSKSYHKVIITDVSPKAFEFFQQYIYHLNPKMTNEIAVDLIYLCHKYMLTDLEGVCMDHMINADAESVAYCVSNLIKKYKFIDIATTIMNQSGILESPPKFQQIFDSDNFVEYSVEFVVSLLDNGKSKMKEEEIWKKCILWSQHTSDHDEDSDDDDRIDERKVDDEDDWKTKLKLLVPYIRFPLMNPSFFVNSVLRAESFQDGHVLAEIQIITTLSYFSDDKKDKSSLVFRANSRAAGPTFTWDLCHESHKWDIVDKQKTKIWGDSDKPLMFSSKTGWREGVHEWTIKWKDNGRYDIYTFEIGIISNSKEVSKRKHKSMGSSVFGDTYYFYRGKCYTNENGHVEKVCTIVEEYKYSEVKVVLDCERWEVRFQIGDREESIFIQPNQEYFPALCHREGVVKYSLIFDE